MKNRLLILLLLVGCTDNNLTEPSIEQQEALLLSMFMPVGYYDFGQGSLISSEVYLTDNNGRLIAHEEIMDGGDIDLFAKFDHQQHEYHATFVEKFTVGGKTRFLIKTFNNIRPTKILYFNRPENLNPDNVRANIHIEKTNGLIKEFISNRGLSSEATSNNGGYLDLEFKLDKIPDDIYFSFINESDNTRRYLWLENLSGTTNDTIDYSTIPEIQYQVKVDYPENDQKHTALYGIKSGKSECYPLSGYFGARENTNRDPGTFYFPIELFDKLLSVTTLKVNDASYKTIKESSPDDLNYELPTIDFQKVNTSIENFEITSASTFDYFSSNFKYENEDYAIYWDFYGEGNGVIHLNLPESQLLDEIFSQTPDFQLSNLTYQNASISRIEGLDTYKDYMEFNVNRFRNELVWIKNLEQVTK